MSQPISTPTRQDAAYAALRRELSAQGLFEPDVRGYVLHMAWVVPAYLLGWWLLLQVHEPLARLLLAGAEAIVMMQGAALGHEAGHQAVSRRARINLWVGRIFMSLGSGSSQASWKEMHDRHHRHANSRLDPNLKARLFCFTEEDARQARGLQAWCTRHQPLLFWPLITLMGVSFRLNSLHHMLKFPRNTRVEQALVLLHHLLWLALPALLMGVGQALANYLLVLWGCGAYLAAIFVANHLGHPTAPCEGASFMARQAGNARNLRDGWLMRRFFVGLNSHIEHHLFQRISFTRLHRARAATRRHCEAEGIVYHEVGILAALAELHRHNLRMAELAGAGLGSSAVSGTLAESESP
ncbi:MAG TPA: fatty acid desaturase [Gammaproteobacteria bacterium]|jgi:fatty acid desaturase